MKISYLTLILATGISGSLYASEALLPDDIDDALLYQCRTNILYRYNYMCPGVADRGSKGGSPRGGHVRGNHGGHHVPATVVRANPRSTNNGGGNSSGTPPEKPSSDSTNGGNSSSTTVPDPK